MATLYTRKSSYAKPNAQENLAGRSHYCDNDTLRFFKSRIISTHITDGGLLFALVESVQRGWTRDAGRGFRFVVFDVYGNTVGRDTETYYSTSAKASKAMWEYLNTLDAVAITHKAVEDSIRNHAYEVEHTREQVAKLIAEGKTITPKN